MFSVSIPHPFYSLAPKDDLNIMSPELTGCFYKMDCHTTGITTFIIMQEHQMNLLVLSESAGMFKSSGQVSTGKDNVHRCTPNIPSIELQVEYPSQRVFTGKGFFLHCFNKIFIFHLLKPYT